MAGIASRASWIVAASVGVVEALKDQGGFCRWNRAISSLHQYTKNRISSSAPTASAHIRRSMSSSVAASNSSQRLRKVRTEEKSEESVRTVMYLSCWGPNCSCFLSSYLAFTMTIDQGLGKLIEFAPPVGDISDPKSVEFGTVWIEKDSAARSAIMASLSNALFDVYVRIIALLGINQNTNITKENLSEKWLRRDTEAAAFRSEIAADTVHIDSTALAPQGSNSLHRSRALDFCEWNPLDNVAQLLEIIRKQWRR